MINHHRLKYLVIRLLRRITFLFSVFLVISTKLLIAQQYYFDNYGVSEGLEQMRVFTILQDRNDFIWLGTKVGVSRFDGSNFINYSSQDGLANKGVRAMELDSVGNIWLGHTGGGIARYDGKKFEIIHLLDSVLVNDITHIKLDKYKNLWILSDGSGVVQVFNPDAPGDQLRYKQYKGDQLSDLVYSTCITKDSSAYFITNLGIKQYNYQDKKFESYILKGMPLGIPFTTMIEDHKGNLWFGTYTDGLYKYDIKQKEFTFFTTRDGLASNFISALYEDSRKNIWIGSYESDFSFGGLTALTGKNQFKAYTIENGLYDNSIWCIKEDVEGNILIGTREHGLMIYKGERFISYTEDDGLPNNQVWAIMEDNRGRYWFGTDGGVSVNELKKDIPTKITSFNQSNSEISNQIRFIIQDNNKTIWIGTDNQGVFFYNQKSNTVSRHLLINSYLIQSFLTVTALQVDKDNNLWIGSLEGLLYYEINNNKIQTLRQAHGLAGNKITALYIDSKNNVWVGSESKGLTRIQGTDFSIIDLGGGITPTVICADKEGKQWIGTEGTGIYVLQNDTILNHYTVEDGILGNLITLINVDEENNVFIGSNRGLNKYNQKNQKWFSYTEKTGFTSIETNNNASYTDSKGNIWFGTFNGVIKYNPREDLISENEPLTHIIGMRINGEEHEMSGGLKLNYKENSIYFEYISICLSNPDAVEYKVMLEGFDTEWQSTQSQTSVNYRSLPPGKYTFNIIAKNSAGIWNSQPISYSFQIRPPYYQTWWFFLIVAMVALSGIFAFIKIRERNLIREKRILELRVKQRTVALSKANEQLAMKNKDITDSIRYAQRIQFAILPPEIPFKDTFIFFRPKDIVSGDFYWINFHDDKELFAAVDCTGHGVPGAFMSFIGYTSLNKIVKEHGITKPAEILNRLDQEVAQALHQQGDDAVNDGMDIALACYDPKTKILEFAGAFNPLVLVRDGEPLEYKANRFAIGRSIFEKKEFTNNEIKTKKGDTVYLFSDGYGDQFGGKDGKKFKSKKLKELFTYLYEKDMEEQRKILELTFDEYKGEYEQIDDILIIGRKI